MFIQKWDLEIYEINNLQKLGGLQSLEIVKLKMKETVYDLFPFIVKKIEEFSILGLGNTMIN